ncbi:MAG: MFS transporter [Acidobacteriota bacterium]|nr:MFS transporter [Acidobacteriota bacterium]
MTQATENGPPSEPSAGQRRRGPLSIIFFTILLDLLGFGMILPLLPFYALTYGASALEIGLLSSVYSLGQFLFAPFWGQLSDRWGRRRVLLVTIFATSIAHLLLALAPSLWMLFLARAAAGIFAANYSTAQAYVADVTTGKDRAKGMGLVGAAFGLGFVLGPAMGAILAEVGGHVAVPLAAAALSLLNFVLAVVRLPESLPPEARHTGEERFRLRWFDFRGLEEGSEAADGGGGEGRKRSLIWLLALVFLVVFAFSAMESMLALFCEERFGFGVKETGLLLVFIGVLMVIIQGGLIGRLTHRFGERALILTGIVVMMAGLALLPLAFNLGLLLLFSALLAIGSGLYTPSIPALISRLTSAGRQGATLGLTRSPSSLARAVGPFWGGWMFEHLGPEWPFWGSSVVMVLALVLGVWVLAGWRSATPASGGALSTVPVDE